MSEELIEHITWDGNVVQVRPKSDLKKEMFPHKVSLIIPQEDGKLLLCRRAKDKHPFPDTWCCAVGGKVSAGESFEAAAMREMLEEIGTEEPVEHVASFKYDEDDYKALFSVFTTKNTIPRDKIKIDKSEIQYLRAFSVAELKELITNNPEEFAPTFRAVIKAFTESKKWKK